MKLNDVFTKIIFLLGAGASKDANCKLSKEMLESLEYSINDITDNDHEYIEYKEEFIEIYHFILASLNYEVTIKNTSHEKSSYQNIEDFLMVLNQLKDKEFIIPYPLIGNWNDKILKWELRKEDVFQKFKDFIMSKLINEWTQFDETKAESLLQPLRNILNNSEEFKINIFSLNYDLIFENTFNTANLRLLDNGFSERDISDKKIRYWTSDYYDNNSLTKVNLYKLHGSIDWVYDKDTEDILIKDRIDDGVPPLIIFGSYSKMLSIDPFLYILSHFRKMLEEATIFIVIGYSFHDKYINNLLIQQLNQNTDEDVPKKMIIVDPSLKEKTEAQFVDEIKNIQSTRSINDFVNFKHISPDRIQLIAKPASEFYKGYFSNDASMLIQILEQITQAEKVF